MGRRAHDPWFSEDGRPVLQDGLYKNTPDGDYLYDFRSRRKHLKGKTGTANEALARAFLANLKQRLKDEAHGRKEIAPPTLRALWKEWDRLNQHLSPSHVRYMKGVVHQHTGAFLDRPAPELTQAAFLELRSTYLAGTGKGHLKNGPKHPGDPDHVVRKHSEGGWNKAAGQLRALYRWGVAMGLIRAVPFKVELLAVSLGARGMLWPEDTQKFLAAVDRVRKERKGDLFPHAGIAARLMLGLGLRENEALNLEWDRVDWRRSVAIIAMSSTGKKVKDRTVREVPIPGWLKSYLLAWWGHCARPATGLVLIARNGKAHGDGATKKAVRKGGAALKLTNLTPHVLRKTYATNLFETGTDVNQIAELLGHDDPRLTLERYIIRRPRALAESVENAAAAMGFTMNPQIVPTT